jgi:hypothetical protein
LAALVWGYRQALDLVLDTPIDWCVIMWGFLTQNPNMLKILYASADHINGEGVKKRQSVAGGLATLQ